MLTYLLRTFVILAAALGLGAIGGRMSRRRGRHAPSARPTKAARRGGVVSPTISDKTVLAGASAGEAGQETGGSNLSTAPRTTSVAEGSERDATQRSAPRRPLPNEDELESVSLPKSDASLATGSEPETPASFGSFAGGGVSAPVLRDSGAGGNFADVTATDAGTGAGDEAAAASATLPLAAPDPHGPTPPASDRSMLETDALAEKHSAPPFDRDFRTVDYGSKAQPVSHQVPDARNDGWTVPDASVEHGIAVPSDSPAAFKGSGVSAPLRGAPEGGNGGTASLSSEDQAAEMPLAAGAVEGASSGDSAADGPSFSAGPEGLDAPRGGVPDDLTRISGIGPSIERLLFASGIFHFDQIASWGEEEIFWADALSGFRGRATREKWVEQAQLLTGTSPAP